MPAEPPNTVRRIRSAVMGLSAVALLSLSAFVVLSDDEPVQPIPATTTTTTVAVAVRPTEPPTTAPPAVDPNVHVIATSAVPELQVLAAAPVEVADLPPAERSARATWAAFTAERPGAPGIPTLDNPVQGRHASVEGWIFGSPTAFGSTATFLVTEQRGDWVKVALPVRPHTTEGWVRASEVTLSTTSYRIEVSLAERRVRLHDGPTLVHDAPVVIGRTSSPTPTGRFYVTDSMARGGGSYGTGILALSAYSQALDQFSGGVPVIALHGTNRPDLLGQMASNGCVRMENATIDLLRATVPLGTPVDIHA